MSSLGFKTVVVYHGEACLGEMEVVPVKDHPNFQFPNNEIRIHRLSPPSERCPPLSVLQTVSSFSVRCKLETSSSSLATPPPIATSAPPTEQNPLTSLHSSCFYEFKTAVVITGEEEIHLVAMRSKQKKFPSFWCFAVPLGLYDSCLAMLNLRCLAIVFDLDETLIVANTMKSFEDRIEALRVWIARETDPVRASGMSAELKRYIDDRLLLKQYTENDCVVDGNGKVVKIQMEEVPQLSDSHEKVVRPVIRLQERNIVLTRINPEIRDTSVLVRLRPAWEDLRSYLTARGRKRFEVYVCTMAERDYALEMWRLLDPEAHLISTKQLLERVVCVKSGSRKSLSNVFQAGMCHPKMAMVIDDRSKVWEDKDQPRVHMVPPFTPYYAPQAEMANAVPVLCVARNVACNVRGYFFKEFDENLIRRISEVFYEDEVMNLPATPDVSNYMMSEDAGFVPNGNGNGPMSEGMSGVEVERRFNQLDEKSPELTSEVPHPPVATTPNTVGPPSSTFMPSHKPSLLGAPVRRDLRNQTSGQPPLLSKVPVPISSSVQTQNRSSGFGQDSDSLKSDKQRALQNPFGHSMSSSGIAGLVSNAPQVKSEEVAAGSDSQKQSLPPGNQPSEVGVSQNHASSNNREFQNEAGRSSMLPSHLSIEVLREIGRRCSSEVEFRSIVSTSKDLQFSVEVLFTGEKIGVGMGKTKKIAQQQAAENALHCLAEKYMAYIAPLSGVVDQDFDKLSLRNENGFVWDGVNPGPSEAAARQDGLPTESTTEAAEAEAGSASNLVIPQLQRHPSSPRCLCELDEFISTSWDMDGKYFILDVGFCIRPVSPLEATAGFIILNLFPSPQNNELSSTHAQRCLLLDPGFLLQSSISYAKDAALESMKNESSPDLIVHTSPPSSLTTTSWSTTPSSVATLT